MNTPPRLTHIHTYAYTHAHAAHPHPLIFMVRKSVTRRRRESFHRRRRRRRHGIPSAAPIPTYTYVRMYIIYIALPAVDTDIIVVLPRVKYNAMIESRARLSAVSRASPSTGRTRRFRFSPRLGSQRRTASSNTTVLLYFTNAQTRRARFRREPKAVRVVAIASSRV